MKKSVPSDRGIDLFQKTSLKSYPAFSSIKNAFNAFRRRAGDGGWGRAGGQIFFFRADRSQTNFLYFRARHLIALRTRRGRFLMPARARGVSRRERGERVAYGMSKYIYLCNSRVCNLRESGSRSLRTSRADQKPAAYWFRLRPVFSKVVAYWCLFRRMFIVSVARFKRRPPNGYDCAA